MSPDLQSQCEIQSCHCEGSCRILAQKQQRRGGKQTRIQKDPKEEQIKTIAFKHNPFGSKW